ncbi:Uncharacterized protein OBRU01_10093, partial [Operophtera brumata]
MVSLLKLRALLVTSVETPQ